MRKLIIFLMAVLFSCSVYASDYENHWAKDYITLAIDNNFASGVNETDFEPDRNIERCEFIKLLINYTQVKSSSLFTTFNDVDTTSWYFSSVAAAEHNDIIKGYDDGGFHPHDLLTREDAITFICRAYNISPPKENLYTYFQDFHTVSSYAENYITFSVKNKLLSGYDNNTLKPKNNITRAEAIVLLTKFSDLSFSFEQAPRFVSGYPKMSSKGKLNNITFSLKTNTPCNIYYKALKSPSQTPSEKDITDILAITSKGYEEITASIIPKTTDDEYDIYFLAVTDNGSTSKIESFKSAKALVYSEGTGTLENPYIIYNENQLDYIRYCQDKHFKLASDITLTKEWTPIDASENDFGSLNGNGYTISNLKINKNHDYVGFFSIIKSGVIKNLTIKGDIKGKNNIGIFAGKNEGCTISGCVALGSSEASSNNAGGIAGVNNGNITNCLSALYSVSSKSHAGGVAGTNSGNITNCLSAVYSVTSGIYSGGIAGLNPGGCIKNSLCANQITRNELAYNNGIITTNRENGVTINNYSFKDTNVNVSNSLADRNNINGMTVTWKDITDILFYKNTLKWNMSSVWKFQDFKTNNFVLPIPSSFKDITDNVGKTPYSPIKISDKDDFDNITPDNHYILINDIYYNDTYYSKNSYSEFEGSFDGRGHTIYGIKIPYSENKLSYNIFGNISENSAVRNLHLKNLHIFGDNEIGILSSSNYGTIENCSVSGKVYSEDRLTSCGGIALYNFGLIDNTDSFMDFDLKSSSLTLGGITAHNEGFINNSSYKGHIRLTSKNSDSSTGGIAGLNNGFIYNCGVNSDISVASKQCYIGGISGILNSGEIFKTSSKGLIKTDSDISYSGGITGLSAEGLIFSSFSSMNINTSSDNSYSGGISGYNSMSSIQECYSVNTINQTSKTNPDSLYAGGIAGFNEEGFISSNVSINPWILSSGKIKRTANCENAEFLSNNYAFSDMIKDTDKSPENGISVPLKDLYNTAFFFTPVYEGGRLGWISDKYEQNDAVWTNPNNIYRFPLLKDVKLQSEFITPQEF